MRRRRLHRYGGYGYGYPYVEYYTSANIPPALLGVGETGAGLTSGEMKFGAIVTLIGVVGMVGLVKGLTHWDTVIRQQSARRRARMRAATAG